MSAQFIFNNPNQTGACGLRRIGAAHGCEGGRLIFLERTASGHLAADFGAAYSGSTSQIDDAVGGRCAWRCRGGVGALDQRIGVVVRPQHGNTDRNCDATREFPRWTFSSIPSP